MTEKEIYELLWKRLEFLTKKLNIEEYTILDEKINTVSREIALHFSENALKEKAGS